jgi:hypothetical protein
MEVNDYQLCTYGNPSCASGIIIVTALPQLETKVFSDPETVRVQMGS